MLGFSQVIHLLLMSYKRIKIIYVSVFVTRETAALKAVFDFLLFNATPCNFTGLIVNAAAEQCPAKLMGQSLQFRPQSERY